MGHRRVGKGAMHGISAWAKSRERRPSPLWRLAHAEVTLAAIFPRSYGRSPTLRTVGR
jgi:hypothetical protein